MNALVLCATKSNHTFENLKSYLNVVDYVILYDTGLSQKELNAINDIIKYKEKIYIRTEFKDFSQMRNDALAFVPEFIQWVIMPDDSWSIHNITREHLIKMENYDIIQVPLLGFFQTHNIHRIFKRHLRFKGKVHEYIECKHLKIIHHNQAQFIDEKPNIQRTEERLLRDIEWLKEDLSPRNMFYLANTLMYLNRNEEAEYYLLKRLETIDNPEEYAKAKKLICYLNK